MTTILADVAHGVMVSDTLFTDGDRRWTGRKVFRIHGALVGIAGSSRTYLRLLEALRERRPLSEVWRRNDEAASLLVLRNDGLFVYSDSPDAEKVASGREAVGTGALAAMAVHEALGWSDPKRAVAMAVKHDVNSGAPIRVYKLNP